MNGNQIQIKWKLLLTYLAVVAVCIAMTAAITRELTISDYSQHLSEMAQSGMGGMMNSSMMISLEQTFRDALNVSLIWGGLAAAGVAVILSFAISRRITSPIRNMAAVTEKIAEGDYSQRVVVKNRDEIGSLAESLNCMAGRLQESQRMRREMMANIAHELRTPLTSISGYMEGLADGVVPASPEIYHLVHGEAARLSRLVDDLQRLSRAESGGEELDIIKLPTGETLKRVSKKLEPQLGEKHLQFDVSVAPDTPPMMADSDKIEQVLMNLLDNAVRYTDVGGRISLEAAPHDGSVQISVADNGMGIAADDLPHIFERFYRADKSRSREKGGSGIGLTIVKRYVESLGGDIAVSSAPGKGTRFTVKLPAAMPH